jgi:hypothetical protein
MFNWLKGGHKKPTYTDVIWATSAEKWAALPALVEGAGHVHLYGWFDDTIAAAEACLGPAARVLHGREFSAASAHGHHIIVLEHYPLRAREAALLSASEPASIRVLSALNEPLLQAFGGNEVANMMSKMGLASGETVAHPLIGKSIAQAQERLAEKVLTDFATSSAQDWFRRYAAMG